MKKVTLLKSALLAAIAATLISIPAAYGAESGTQTGTSYPANFSRDLELKNGLTDYAVDGNSYAFASETTVYVLYDDENGDRQLSFFTHESQITKIDYAEGKLYFENKYGKVYSYDGEATPDEHQFTQNGQWKVDLEGGDMYTLEKTEGKLTYWTNGTSTLLKADGEEGGEGGFSDLKTYGEDVYAVRNNRPYRLNGAQAEPLDLAYTDFSAAEKIIIGDTATNLKKSGYTVKTAIVADGAYYTQIDLDDLAGKQATDYFKTVKTLKSNGKQSCFILAESGDASIVAMKDGCYILRTQDLAEVAYSAPANDWQGRAYARIEAGVYSSPYMSKGTKIATLKCDPTFPLTVTEKFALDFIDNVFYKVSYVDANGTTVTGYVAANFLDKYSYSADDNDGTTVRDDEPKYDSDVTTVILVLVIIGLVIIAIAYLTIVGTKPADKKKKDKKKKNTKADDGDDES